MIAAVGCPVTFQLYRHKDYPRHLVIHHLGLLFEIWRPLKPVLHVIKVRGHARKSCS